MNQPPDKIYLRRSEARYFLGLSEAAFTKLIRAGVLQPKYFPGMTYAYFTRSEVVQLKAEPKTNSK